MNLHRVLGILVVGTCVMVGFVRGAPGQPAYLAEMPSVEMVRSTIKGTSPVDTLAHQAAVFDVLRQIVEVRTERPGSLADPSRLSPGERAIIEAYQQASREIFATPGVDRRELLSVGMRYSANPNFTDEVAARFFSPAWLAGYAASRAKFQAAYAASPLRDSPAPPVAKAGDKTGKSVAAKEGFLDRKIKGMDGEEITIRQIVVGGVKALGALAIAVLLAIRTYQRFKNAR